MKIEPINIVGLEMARKSDIDIRYAVVDKINEIISYLDETHQDPSIVGNDDIKSELKRAETALGKEKNLDRITFYEGYIKGLKFRASIVGENECEHSYANVCTKCRRVQNCTGPCCEEIKAPKYLGEKKIKECKECAWAHASLEHDTGGVLDIK
jgi:hypothetical protein